MPSHRFLNQKKTFFPCWAFCMFLICLLPANALSDTNQLIFQGKKALENKDFLFAEKLFAEALEQDPTNYAVIKPLVQIKFHLEKYSEAEELANRILAMPIARGRQVMVYMKGESQPLEAEVVDETVMAPAKNQGLDDKFLRPGTGDKVPHYRLYVKNSGKIELIPKSEAKIEYKGLPQTAHQEMKFFLAKIRKKRVAAFSGDTRAQEMVELEGGCFLMGSDKGDVDEKPVHEVCLSPFKIDKYEVIQVDFQKLMGDNPSMFVGANLPADSVTWKEAVEYCGKIGKRLPTEAEWEYAARGGTRTAFYFGDKITGKEGNFCDSACSRNFKTPDLTDGFEHTAPVGSFLPNPFGLHDMAGNVAEWVHDWQIEHYYRISPKKDPQGPGPTDYKIMRGGGWLNNLDYLRSANRTALWHDYRDEGVGFRCVAGLDK